MTAKISYRDKTRRERQDLKLKQASFIPVEVACLNFGHEANLAFCVRAAACLGVQVVNVIGNTSLTRALLNALSGSTYDYTKIVFHKTPQDFLEHCLATELKLVAMELPSEASGFKSESIHNYKFDFPKKICIITGSETTGVPVEVLKNSDIIHIPMIGSGYCLNTSHALTIGLYEAAKQWESRLKVFDGVLDEGLFDFS